MNSKVLVISAEVEPRLKLSLISRVAIRRNEAAFTSSPDEIQDSRTWRTIQIDFNRHVANQYMNYVDHSCEPNTVFDIDTLSLVALRDIEKGEPLSFFYPGAEVELAQPFVCECGKPTCFRHLNGAFYLTLAQMRETLARGYCTSFIAAHFRRFLDEAAGDPQA